VKDPLITAEWGEKYFFINFLYLAVLAKAVGNEIKYYNPGRQ